MNYAAYGKPAAGSAVLFFLMNANRLFQGEPLQTALNLVVWASFTVILFIPKTRRTKSLTTAALGIVLLETAVGLIWFQEIKLIYFVAILLFAAAVRLSLSRTQAPAVMVVLVTAAIYARFGRDDLFSIISFIFFAAVLYFFIRSRMQRNQMNEMNKRHLAELQDAYDQLQQASATAMQYAVLEERTRIARDIHDAVGHSLTSLIVQLQALRYMVKDDPQRAGESLDGMLSVARQGLQDIRTSVHALADNRSVPGITALKSLLARMEATASIRYALHTDLTDEDMPAEGYETLFRVLQEAITNVIRHSRATKLDVSLVKESGCLVMTIRDNGIAEADCEIREGYGLRTMKTRLTEQGGSLQIAAAEPSGLKIVATIPYAAERDRDEQEQE
ncbi:sensor histidine kinase [Paenibacillus doosanensis]|uniref:sensor histidine kinase n=1 Tax=Paenibacillus doosanensis TaxID=1229154 RepID=UPI00217F49AE|nr:sensor histidine kinase [Paenibacillus doosanensis]MCS7461935.1 sensor histidine kinase [Paenibacillus doosanensis]